MVCDHLSCTRAIGDTDSHIVYRIKKKLFKFQYYCKKKKRKLIIGNKAQLTTKYFSDSTSFLRKNGITEIVSFTKKNPFLHIFLSTLTWYFSARRILFCKKNFVASPINLNTKKKYLVIYGNINLSPIASHTRELHNSFFAFFYFAQPMIFKLPLRYIVIKKPFKPSDNVLMDAYEISINRPPLMTHLCTS